MWEPSIVPHRMGSVWLTSPSFQSLLDVLLEGYRPIKTTLWDVTRPTWRDDWSKQGGGQPLSFYRRSRPARKKLLGTADSAKTHIGHRTPQPRNSSKQAARRCMAPSPCIMMNPVQGSPSQDAKQLHQKEETDTESEELQPKDMTTEKGYKLQRSSLPFSVESLISKKTTCRTSYSSSDLALVLPKPVAGQGEHLSPRTFYAERKISAESSQGVSSSSSEDSPQFCEKDQSTWFQTSSFSTPPRKSVPPQLSETKINCIYPPLYRSCITSLTVRHLFVSYTRMMRKYYFYLVIY